jgi:hypothetical protein
MITGINPRTTRQQQSDQFEITCLCRPVNGLNGNDVAAVHRNPVIKQGFDPAGVALLRRGQRALVSVGAG